MITRDELIDILRYEPDTGLFYWTKDIGHRFKSGQQAGSLHCRGYVAIRIRRKPYMAHRLAWLYMIGEWPVEIDHKNGIRNDNRFTNLRSCTRQENEWNKVSSVSLSGHRGVSYCKPLGKWMATIKINKKNKYLGLFNTIDDAAEAYKEAAIRTRGEFSGFLNRGNT